MANRENVITHFRDAIEASGNGNKWRFVREGILEDAIDLLKEQPNAVQCKDCKYWGKKSGLTARKCSRQGIITGQFDFCSYGRTVKQNDSN